MKFTRLISFVAVWALIASIIHSLIPGLPDLFEPRTACFVLALPWLLSFAGPGPRDVLLAIRDSFASDSHDLPLDRRRNSAAILRTLGSLSISTGVVAFFATGLAASNQIAMSGGQGNPIEFVVAAPTAFMAPLYGYLLRVFVYEPLAASIDCTDSGLGMELDELPDEQLELES